MISETERTSPYADLRQGDILRFEIDELRTRRPSLGAIINADCDLAHRKTDGLIAYLPIYTFHQYLEEFWAPTFVENTKSSLVDEIYNICKLKGSNHEELMSWIETSGHEVVTKKLTAQHKVVGKRVAALSLRATLLHECCICTDSYLATFAKVAKTKESPHQFARKHIEDARRSMGEGHFFLSEIVGEEHIGFVIRMRRIDSIVADSCYRSISEMKSMNSVSESAYRVARLTPTFKYRFMQVFAAQYSRIGLPDEISELSSLAVDDMLSKILGKTI